MFPISGHIPTEEQMENLRKIKKISDKFHKDADISVVDYCIDFNNISEGIMIFESGHQPNYFPYPGTWKKAFLLDFFHKKIENSIALFGFADYNLCTAPILYSNKNGNITIGITYQRQIIFSRMNANIQSYKFPLGNCVVA